MESLRMDQPAAGLDQSALPPYEIMDPPAATPRDTAALTDAATTITQPPQTHIQQAEQVIADMRRETETATPPTPAAPSAAAATRAAQPAQEPYPQGFASDNVIAAGFNPACCPGYYPGYVSSYRRQGHACVPQCPPGFRFSALWDACVPIAPAVCHAAPCQAPAMGCGCAKQYPTHHKQGYGTVANCYYPGANSTCAPGYTRVGDKCVWTKW